MKRLLFLVALVLFGMSGTANAENAATVAAALRTSPVYQSPGLDLVDVATLQSELNGSDPQVDVAVLPERAATSDRQARALAIGIGKALGDSNAVVLVITAGGSVGAGNGSGAFSRGVNAPAALAAERPSLQGKAFNKDNITAFVTSFKERIANQANGRGGSTVSGGTTNSSHSGAYLLGGLVLIGGGATAVAVRSSRRRRARLNEGLRADVEQLYNRLGSDVASLDAKSNVVAQQALADASERYNACGATLASADAPAEFAAARRTAVEGLTAARVARKELGLDLGPEIPATPGSGPQLTAEQQVQLGGQTFDGSPNYSQGASTTTAAAMSAVRWCRGAGTRDRSGSPSCSARCCPAGLAAVGCSEVGTAVAVTTAATRRAVRTRALVIPVAPVATGAGALVAETGEAEAATGAVVAAVTPVVAAATGSPQLACRWSCGRAGWTDAATGA